MNNYKILSILIVILITFITNSDAQISSDDLSIVYTKNGSIIKGHIVEYDQSNQLKLKLINGTIITLNSKKIKKIYSNGLLIDQPKKNLVAKQIIKEYAFSEMGVYFASSLPIMIGHQVWNNNPTLGIGFHQTVGYHFNRYFGAGLGLGFDAYYPSSGQKFIPIYAEARGYMLNDWVTPMYSVAAGYGLIPNTNSSDVNLTDKKGGLFFHPAIGFRVGAAENANFTIDFGFKYQKGSFVYNEWGNINSQEVKFQRFTLRTGIVF